jgi:hypothetical protein
MDVQPYEPFPLSEDRSETPLSTFDSANPYTGLELIVSGLPPSTPDEAIQHFNDILERLRGEGADFPALKITPPANVQPQDFVYVSLTGPLRETPRPDILEKVRVRLHSVEGIKALWKVAPGRVDKTRQIYFQVDTDTQNITDIKGRMDRILQGYGYRHQGSYIPANSNRIFYHLLNPDHITALQRNPIIIDSRSYYPHRSRYVQPIFGLELAVPGVGELSQARSVIDHYIECHFNDDPTQPVVRHSRLALDDTVYCVVLRTPEITQRVLAARENFQPFADSSISPNKPQYLYALNASGIPLAPNSRFTSSRPDPILQRQLDQVNAQTEATAATLRQVVGDVKHLANTFQEAQSTITKAFSDSTDIYTANNLLTAAQADVSNLSQTIATQNILLRLTPPADQADFRAQLLSLQEQLNVAKAIKDRHTAEVIALKAAQRPLPLITSPQLSSDTTSTSSHKRPRLQAQESAEEQEVLQMAVSMEVDQQVRNIISSLILFFNFFSPLLHSVAIRVHLLLEGLQTAVAPKSHARPFSYVQGSSSSSSTLFLSLSLSLSFPTFLFIAIVFFSLFPLVYALPAMNTPLPSPTAPFPSMSFCTVSINANGFSNPMKISAIQNVASSLRPHALVIGETKSVQNVGPRLFLPDYEIYENPGQPSGPRSGKWGVIVAIRRGLFTVHQLLTPDSLRGRAIALDLTIPTVNNKAFQHRLLGIYGPWDPGGFPNNEYSFWSQIATLCNAASFSWSLYGDFNATLSGLETTSTSPSVINARAQYSQFLHLTNAVDLWQSQPQSIASPHLFSCKTQHSTDHHLHTYSLIDRVAASRTGILAGEIAVHPSFIPCTDHRPIFSRLVLDSPLSHVDRPQISLEASLLSYSPRFRHPLRHEKTRLDVFSSAVSEKVAARSDVQLTPITSDLQFQHVYDAMTDILLSSAKSSFLLPTPPRPPSRITNPTIKLLLTEIHHINRLVGALKLASCTPLTPLNLSLYLPRERWVPDYVSAFFCEHPNPTDINSSFRSYLTILRRNLHKLRFAEERQERQHQLNKRSRNQFLSVLHGGSSKRLYPHSFSSLPLALNLATDQEPDCIVTGPSPVKDATVNYFLNLYHRTERPPQHKPWLTTPSVLTIKESTSHSPFPWPVLLSISDLRKLLSKGNARPTPGPDGWEKWFLKHLRDDALSPVLSLLNYIISSSHFPDCLKPTNISTIHKRGPTTFLSNYRGIACNNVLLNLPFAWLNYLLTPYLAQHRVIPECQVATQPGTQGRDLISYVSQVERWASREAVPLFILQRDQRKGFDMLEPQGFYDALSAYGLPESIIDLDRSSQLQVPYRVKTAYGFTDPFIVNGVTKQGGSLSPLKCTLTTSLCNRWMHDLQGNEFIIQTHQARLGSPHTPTDSTSLSVSMIEAMDDSLIIKPSLSSLKTSARLADRFQATYGWETEWRKSALYIYGTQVPDSAELHMPSVDYTDPQSPRTSWHPIPVVTDHTTFLRVPINQPDKQFAFLQDVISNFHFPLSAARLPLTVLRRLVSQCVISKIRPHLALQPISDNNAAKLDSLLASKIHQYLHFPFRFHTILFSTPLDLRGLGFPSIARLNASLAVSGLHHDLTHHLPSFRKMASITLSDWSCKLNRCIHPLSPPYSLTHNPTSRSSRLLPFSWLLAASFLSTLHLSILPTDLSYILDGSVALQHLLSQFRFLLPSHPSPPNRTIFNFHKHGFTLLRHFGSFLSHTSLPHTPLFLPFSLQFPDHQYYLTRDWHSLCDWFQFLPQLLVHLSFPDLSLLHSPSVRQQLAEDHIRHLIASPLHSFPFPHSPAHSNFIACDGSSLLNPISRKRSTTFAVAAAGSAFAASLHPKGHHTGILHGEVYGLIAASLLSQDFSDPHIFSDHLNSIKLLSSSPSLLSLHNNPARSLYRWLLNIWSSGPQPLLSYVRAHTGNSDIASTLNHIADLLATASQHFSLPPPTVPVPTFFMDNFMLFSHFSGFIESSISSFVDYSLASAASQLLDTCHEPLPPLPLFDLNPPPPYPYLKAPSSYSAVIQLYARSGQLDTQLSLSTRLKDHHQPWCRFGCSRIEDAHHLFVQCPAFSSLRTLYQQRLLDALQTILHIHTLSPEDLSFIHDHVRGLFMDSPIWPSKRSAYYIGLLPPFLPSSRVGSRLHLRIMHSAHIVCIQLAGRIWGEVRRRTFHSPQKPSVPSSSIQVATPTPLARFSLPSSQ